MTTTKPKGFTIPEYVAMGRQEMLRLTRAWGVTAHKLDNAELAKLLYQLQQRERR